MTVDYYSIRDKVFTYPVDAEKLDVKEIDGMTWVPFCGNKITKELAAKRIGLGSFAGLALVEGWHVTYRPLNCPSVSAIGWMSSYCK